MKLYIERMLAEREDLIGKIKKANTAISSNPYGMDKIQVEMLREQVGSMEQYLGCLNKRLAYEQREDNVNH